MQDGHTRWTCRDCGTERLHGGRHVYCPNCGSRRGSDGDLLATWHEFVTDADRFAGGSSRCCEQSYDLSARFCGRCGSPLRTVPHVARVGSDAAVALWDAFADSEEELEMRRRRRSA